jgi:hypothetical protein
VNSPTGYYARYTSKAAPSRRAIVLPVVGYDSTVGGDLRALVIDESGDVIFVGQYRPFGKDTVYTVGTTGGGR